MIRIAIVDDHAIVRAALELVRTGGIDVMVMDLSMGEQGGVEALVVIKARAPICRC